MSRMEIRKVETLDESMRLYALATGIIRGSSAPGCSIADTLLQQNTDLLEYHSRYYLLDARIWNGNS
jgi:hypothetical protein